MPKVYLLIDTTMKFEACKPSLRWYLHALFAITTNKATAAEQLNKWDLVANLHKIYIDLETLSLEDIFEVTQDRRSFQCKAIN